MVLWFQRCFSERPTLSSRGVVMPLLAATLGQTVKTSAACSSLCVPLANRMRPNFRLQHQIGALRLRLSLINLIICARTLRLEQSVMVFKTLVISCQCSALRETYGKTSEKAQVRTRSHC